MTALDRARYAALYGPTTGDRIRLADTDLLIEIEKDHCVGGDESVFGGGKVIRESMGQSRATRAEGALDLVITGAGVPDRWGIGKAEVGTRDARPGDQQVAGAFGKGDRKITSLHPRR